VFKKSPIERKQACIQRADVRGPAHSVAAFEILPASVPRLSMFLVRGLLAGLRLGSSLMPNRRHSDTSELTNGVAQRQVSIAPDILQAHLQIEHRRTSLQRTAFAWGASPQLSFAVA
jgi:hypothetical protein